MLGVDQRYVINLHMRIIVLSLLRNAAEQAKVNNLFKTDQTNERRLIRTHDTHIFLSGSVTQPADLRAGGYLADISWLKIDSKLLEISVTTTGFT